MPLIPNKQLTLALPVLCALALIAPIGAQAGLLFNTNVIANGDAEAGPGALLNNAIVSVPSWTTITGNLTVVQYRDNSDPNPGIPRFTDPGPVNRGLNFFAGGPMGGDPSQTFFSIGDQLLDISDAASLIDTGTVAFALEGYLGGYLDQRDNASLMAIFKNGANNLGSSTIGPVSDVDRNQMTGLFARSANGFIPTGTRQIDFRLIIRGIDGAQSDGYADNLSFIARGPAAVPEPSSGILMALGILTAGLSRLMRKRAALTRKHEA